MAGMDNVPGWLASLFRVAEATFAWHRAAFIAVNIVITAVNVWMGAPWWGLWPLVVTGALFTLHFLVYSTARVDETWADERAAEIYDRSYDQGHIDAIAEQHDLVTPVARGKRRAEAGEGRGAQVPGAGKARS